MKLHPERKIANKPIALFFIIFFLCSILGEAKAHPQIDLQISDKSFPANAFAIVTITLTNTGDGKLVVPKLQDVQLQKRGQTTQFSSINGAISRSTSYTYILTGEKEGKYILPSVSFITKERTLKSKSVNFTITPAKATNPQQKSPSNTPQQSPTELAILQVTAPQKIYSGESAPAEIKLYLNTNARIERGSITLPAITSEGVIMEPLSSSPQQGQEEYKGQIWDTLSWQTTFTGIKEGKSSLSVAGNATALLQRHETRRRNRSPLDRFFGGNPFDDPFFDSAFSRLIKKPLHPVWQGEIAVLPLPAAGRPENFCGAVGDFDFTVSSRTRELQVGDPLLLEITVNGIGNFNKVEIPTLPEGSYWRTYPPKVHFESIGNSGAGQKIFEQAIVIKEQSVTKIPALSFCYFNPEKEQYITKKSAPIPLTITGKSDNPTGQQNLATTKTQHNQALQQQESDQHLLKIELEKGAGDLRPLPERRWFQGATLFCLLLICGGLLVRYRKRRFELSERDFRKKMLQRLQEDLIPIHAAKENGDATLFLRACRVAIQNGVARHCGIHPSAVSLGDIRRIIPASSPLIKIFSMADQACYGDTEIAVTKLDKLYDQLKAELEQHL